MQKPVWTPSLHWHLKTIALLLVICAVLFFALKAATSFLPEPYQKRTPAAGTTPWLHTK